MRHLWNRRLVLGGMTAAAGLAFSARAQTIGKSTLPSAPFVEVETASGKVRGGHARGALVFKGIPYGGSVRGAGRFKAAPPVTPWTGVYDATHLGPPTLQTPGSTYGEQEPPYSEDCLVLNVWTPAADGRKRPVMLYLHGGGYSTGSAGSTSQDGGKLAATYDVVVVACNHRLGLLGFLYLGDILGEDYTGNQGMQDIVMSLAWIRDNIERFGGDPGNVMVFGESGGGAKVGTLLGMPQAKGLYHKAGIASGAAMHRMPKAVAAETAQRLMKSLDLSNPRMLFDVPAQTLLELQWAGENGQGGLNQATPGWRNGPADSHSAPGFAEAVLPGNFGPVVDGHVLPADPFAGGAVTPLAADIPLMIGSNKEEARFFYMGQPQMYALDVAGLEGRVRADYGDWADRLLTTYRADYPNASPSDLYIAITTARVFGNDTVTLAGLKSAQPAPVYAYRWDYSSNRPIANTTATLGSGHATDIGPTFDNGDLGGLHGDGPGVAAASANLSALWTSFARSGKPSAPGAPDWPRYDTARRATMLVDTTCRIADDPDAAERRLWESLEA